MGSVKPVSRLRTWNSPAGVGQNDLPTPTRVLKIADAAPVEGRSEERAVDHEPRPDLVVPPERASRDPAGRAVRQDREANPHPVLALLVDLAGDSQHEIVGQLGSEGP